MNAWRQPDLFTKRVRSPPPALERETQIWLADLLDKYGGLAPGWDWFHIPNGELRSENTGALLKRMGAKAGVSDFVFAAPPRARLHALELKRQGEQPTDEQIAFLEEVRAAGGQAAWVDNYREAIDVLTSWGAVRVTVSA